MSADVVWHDLECGGYEQDLPLWETLAAEYVAVPREYATVPANKDGVIPEPECASVSQPQILDIGAGTGRVSLTLARAGYRVTAVDLEPDLLAALAERAAAEDIRLETAQGDARTLNLPGRRFELCVVPMQTVQLFGGEQARVEFFTAVRDHLIDGGVLAVAIAASEDFEEFEWHEGDPYPLPDIVERDGRVYCSQPTAVRREGATFVLERRREIIDATGSRDQSHDVIVLDAVTVAEIDEGGRRAGLAPLGIRTVAPTGEHIGSKVVLLGA
jgi:SAM-dependent methyltransferase